MNDRYRHDLQAGLKYQDHAMRLFYDFGIPLCFYNCIENQVRKGENMNGVEVKYDRRFRETSNLYIETRERSSPTSEWHPAGITRKDNSWALAIGDYQTIYVFSMKQLRWLHARKKYKEVATETSQGFLLPLEVAERWSLFTLPKGESCLSNGESVS